MRILVVDDDIAVRMTLSMALDGVQVLEGWRATGVAELAAEGQAEAIVLDRRLPDADGLTAVRAVRARPETADLPIVVITANDDPAERGAAFAAGADEHAVKPVDPQELLSLIKSIAATPAEQRRLRRTLRRARMHVGREDGGWTDLLPSRADVEAARGGKGRRRLFSRAS